MTFFYPLQSSPWLFEVHIGWKNITFCLCFFDSCSTDSSWTVYVYSSCRIRILESSFNYHSVSYFCILTEFIEVNQQSKGKFWKKRTFPLFSVSSCTDLLRLNSVVSIYYEQTHWACTLIRNSHRSFWACMPSRIPHFLQSGSKNFQQWCNWVVTHWVIHKLRQHGNNAAVELVSNRHKPCSSMSKAESSNIFPCLVSKKWKKKLRASKSFQTAERKHKLRGR